MEEIIKNKIYKKLALENDYLGDELKELSMTTDCSCMVFTVKGFMIFYQGESNIRIQRTGL